MVTLNSAAAGTLTFEAGDDIVFNTGRIETIGNPAHAVELRADLDQAGVGAADGDRGSISQLGAGVTEVSTGSLVASAGAGIDLIRMSIRSMPVISMPGRRVPPATSESSRPAPAAH